MKKQVGIDSWKRPVYQEVSSMRADRIEQQLELNLDKPRDATPEEVQQWQNGGDFFMTGNFDPLKLFVVLPTIVQLLAIGFMFSVFILNHSIF